MRSDKVWAPGLEGKTALVTGAGRMRGIGRTVAVELGRQGANVVVTGGGRSPAHYPEEEQTAGWRDIDSVAEEIEALGSGALPLVCDIGDPVAVQAAIDAAVKRFGGIDILVNSAAAARGADRVPIIDVSYEEWARVIRVNLDGAFLIAQAVARRMVEQGRGGAIVNVSSVGSRLAAPANGAYAASKAGLNALSRTMALELASHKIRVNSVLPGIIDTSRTGDVGRDAAWDAFVRQYTPLGVAGDPADVADLCVYLSSDRGKWITGQDFAVDGGATWR